VPPSRPRPPKEPFDRRCPTGIAGIDSRLGGGLPYTLSMLVHGATGGGARELVHTICANVAAMLDKPEARKTPMVTPRDLSYVTLTKPRQDILQEMTWLGARREAFRNQAHFYDLSSKYFGKQDAVARWLDADQCVHVPDVKGLVDCLAATLEAVPKGSLIIVDSISDLASHQQVTASEVSQFLRGLQVATNKWESLVIMLHTTGLVAPDLEREMVDATDAVLEIALEEGRGGERRYRLNWKHIRGLPDALTDFQRVYGILTEEGMNVVELERVA